MDSGDRFLAARRNPQSREAWTRLSDDALLKVRLCDLPLRLEDSWVAGLIEQVKRELSETLGRSVDVVFEVEPKLIAGLKIYIGSQVFDHTVLGRLTSMQGQLTKG